MGEIDLVGIREFKAAHFLAKEKALELDDQLRAGDPRLNGSVLVIHLDGSVFLFDSAFVLLWKSGAHEFALVATEHHGTRVYPMDEITHLRAIGPRLHIESFVGRKKRKAKLGT